MTHMGPAAPCSVIRYESKMFGEKYQNNLFVCSFNLHKVSRHILSPDGATFKTQDTDFLRLHALGVEHSGIVFCRQGKSAGEILRMPVLLHDMVTAEEIVGRVEFL